MNKIDLQNDMTTAMREKDEIRLSIIRVMKSELSTNSKVAKPKSEIDVLKSVAKKLNEEIVLYTQVKQDQKVIELTKQLEYVRTFLPTPLTLEEVVSLLDQYNTDVYTMPALMTYLKNILGDRFDGKFASSAIKDYLNGKKS